MRTLRVVLAGAVVALIGATPMVALAQDEAEPAPPLKVTGTGECHMTTEGATTTGSDGVERYADHVSGCVYDTDDGRLSGAFDLTFDMDCYPTGGCLYWASPQWPGPDGWEGEGRGWISETGEGYQVIVWTGTGANEGLTYVDGGANDLSGDVAIHGVLYEGPPPALMTQ